MNSQPSSAIEKGFTSQLMPTVAAMPRQWLPTWRRAPRSIFSSMGTIISQISTATGRLTSATVASPMAWKTPGMSWPSTMPATMQSATHSVRKRSKVPMAGAAGVAPAGSAAIRHDKFLQRTRRPCSSTTRSPSSLVKAPRCGGARMSSTASEGRQSFTP